MTNTDRNSETGPIYTTKKSIAISNLIICFALGTASTLISYGRDTEHAIAVIAVLTFFICIVYPSMRKIAILYVLPTMIAGKVIGISLR